METALLIHNNTIYLAVPVVLAFTFYYAPRYHYGKIATFAYYVILEILIIMVNNLTKRLGDAVGLDLAYQSARAFLFIPVLTLLAWPIWKIKPLHGADYLTPAVFFIRGIVLIGCAVLGCSNGIPCSWGTLCPNFGYRIFPIDLIDAIATLIIGVFSVRLAKRWHYQAHGCVFAAAMISLGLVRFCLQFGNRDYWWIRGFNEDSVYSIIAIIIGLYILKTNYALSTESSDPFQNGGE